MCAPRHVQLAEEWGGTEALHNSSLKTEWSSNSSAPSSKPPKSSSDPHSRPSRPCSHQTSSEQGLSWWLRVKNTIAMQKTHRTPRLDPWVGKIPWRRKQQPTPLFLPGKSQGQRGLVSYSPWGHKRVRHNLATKHQLISGQAQRECPKYRVPSLHLWSLP